MTAVFLPTPDQRLSVSIAAGAGYTHTAIAAALGISRTTLLKHFAIELTTVAARRRLQVLEAMFSAAKRGSVTAMRAYLAKPPELMRDMTDGKRRH